MALLSGRLMMGTLLEGLTPCPEPVSTAAGLLGLVQRAGLHMRLKERGNLAGLLAVGCARVACVVAMVP